MDTRHNSTPIYTACRGRMNEDVKDLMKYDAGSKIEFWVNYPITIVSFSLFGPSASEGKSVTYEVKYVISIRDGPILTRGIVLVKATPNDKFYVDLGRINIPANVWIEIEFCLKGPKTRRMKNIATTIVVPTKKRNVCFELLRGSFQMPDILFCMEEDND